MTRLTLTLSLIAIGLVLSLAWAGWEYAAEIWRMM